MLPNAERRMSVRTVCSGCIRFSRFNREETISADLIDFSEDGLGFFSTSELKRGSSLLVQVDQAESAESEVLSCLLIRSLGIVEVKWCRPIGDRWNSVYAIGVKYVLP